MEVVRTILLVISFFEESNIHFGFTLEHQYIQIAGVRFMTYLILNESIQARRAADLLGSTPLLAMKKLRPLPPLPSGVYSSSSQLRTRQGAAVVQCVSRAPRLRALQSVTCEQCSI